MPAVRTALGDGIVAAGVKGMAARQTAAGARATYVEVPGIEHSDMILDMLHDERSTDFDGHLTSLEPSVRRVYDQVNELMKQLTD